ncbi:alpha/beta hydrolase [Rhodococcus sp. ARC_M12]|nr:alpha/beta hydrolase [Rhodococcus sp. ARC_M12]
MVVDVPELNLHTFGPADGPQILAVHGVTGHGARWWDLAENHLPEARILAPDLIGHGHSPATPPWDIDAQVTALKAVLDAHARGPVVVLGHSYGGALAVHLAQRFPDAVRALVLLDPAIALPPEELLEVAEATAKSPDYTDADEARSEKIHGAWADVPTELLDREVADHLVPADGGKAAWRMSIPAIVATWGELARPIVVPAVSIPTIVVRAMRVEPPYVTEEFLAALHDTLGENLRTVELDCDHMVGQAKPVEVAELVRSVL